ncbi:MAG: hypothetical protein AB7F09_03400 [Parvibaculaceae bacterium]
MRYPIAARRDPRIKLPQQASETAHWASNAGSLSQVEAEMLCQAVRTLYPHDWLDDVPYRSVVLEITRRASSDNTANLGLKVLVDELARSRFVTLTEAQRIEVFRRMEESDAFRHFQRAAVHHLYNDPSVWAGCGYEGVAGCSETEIRAGINDLDWLAEPELEIQA